MSIEDKIIKARNAGIKLAALKIDKRNLILKDIASLLNKNRDLILKENKKDIENGKNLNSALLKRLELTNKKIDEMITMVSAVIKLDDPIGKTLFTIKLDHDLELYKVSCPIGVIAIIFESRPDVVIQISSLCLKSGNAVILKGGSEAEHSNKILVKIVKDALLKASLSEAVQLIKRTDVKELLKFDNYIDLVIPRGSNKLVNYIKKHTRIPVLGHSSGICHIYVDKDADIDKAIKICYDAKCQYPAVCNAMETLLVHKDIAEIFLKKIYLIYKKGGVELRGCEKTRQIIKVGAATQKDWQTEYNDLILSIKVVDNINEAIKHINTFGSKHTDAIITENKATACKFLSYVDSASVMWNASTRFADGYRYGLGAEIGISTTKIHARGPVGLEGLVIYKYILIGKGHVVADYIHKKKFLHKKLNKVWKCE